VHFRKERFPSQRKFKLILRGDGPFQVLTKINDNAYKIDLPGKYNVSNIFNVSDLFLYDADDELRSLRLSKKEGMMRTSRPKSKLKLQLKNLCKDWEVL